MTKTLLGSWAAMALVACGGSFETRADDESSFGPGLADTGSGDPAWADGARANQRTSVGSVTGAPGGFVLVDGAAFTFPDDALGVPLVEVTLSNRPQVCESRQQSIVRKNESVLYLDLVERDAQGRGIMPRPGVYWLPNSLAGDGGNRKVVGVYILRLNEVCSSSDIGLSLATMGAVTITSLDPEVGVTGQFNVSFDGGANWVSGDIQVPACSLPSEELQPEYSCR